MAAKDGGGQRGERNADEVIDRRKKTHNRASPSRPDDLAWQTSPFRTMLLNASRLSGTQLVSPRRPFCPAGANVRPVHAALDRHVSHVSRLRGGPKKAQRGKTSPRGFGRSTDHLDHPPQPLDSPIPVSPLAQFGTSPPPSPSRGERPESPQSETPTVGQGWRGGPDQWTRDGVESPAREQQRSVEYSMEKSIEEWRESARELGPSVSFDTPISGSRERRTSSDKRASAAVYSLAQTIGYDGEMGPVHGLLGSEQKTRGLGKRVL